MQLEYKDIQFLLDLNELKLGPERCTFVAAIHDMSKEYNYDIDIDTNDVIHIKNKIYSIFMLYTRYGEGKHVEYLVFLDKERSSPPSSIRDVIYNYIMDIQDVHPDDEVAYDTAEEVSETMYNTCRKVFSDIDISNQDRLIEIMSTCMTSDNFNKYLHGKILELMINNQNQDNTEYLYDIQKYVNILIETDKKEI